MARALNYHSLDVTNSSAESIEAQAKAYRRVAGDYREQVRRLEVRAIECDGTAAWLDQQAREAAPTFVVGDICCIAYTKQDGDRRFYCNIRVVFLYANGDVGIEWRDKDRTKCYRRLSVSRCERVTY